MELKRFNIIVRYIQTCRHGTILCNIRQLDKQLLDKQLYHAWQTKQLTLFFDKVARPLNKGKVFFHTKGDTLPDDFSIKENGPWSKGAIRSILPYYRFIPSKHHRRKIKQTMVAFIQ